MRNPDSMALTWGRQSTFPAIRLAVKKTVQQLMTQYGDVTTASHALGIDRRVLLAVLKEHPELDPGSTKAEKAREQAKRRWADPKARKEQSRKLKRTFALKRARQRSSSS